jgi:hypothetical protein
MMSFVDGTAHVTLEKAAKTGPAASRPSKLSKLERKKLREPRTRANKQLAMDAEAAAVWEERQYLLKYNIAPSEDEVSNRS